MNPADITQYIDIANRRKWNIIIPFLLTLLAGLAYVLNTPKTYEAETLILVQSQKVPQDFVRTIVSSDIDNRLRTVTQEVTSRTNLERIIREFKLYSDLEKTFNTEKKVGLARGKIKIDVHGGRRRGEATESFTISFQDQDPKTAMQVTNALASNFITENLKIRESQAIGTSTFISDELQSVENRLMEKEAELKLYREKYMGGLPEQLDTNLRILERLQEQSDQLHSNLRDSESRKIILQTQIADQQNAGAIANTTSPASGQGPNDLFSLKNELASLESRYTQNHPDVIRIKNMIAKLEANLPANEDSSDDAPVLSGVSQALRRQFQDVTFEIKDLRANIDKNKKLTRWHQTKVEETPKREQELLSLNRDYSNLQELYNSLLERKLEAEIAVSMEKKQKGEQFRIVDPAKTPTIPVKPDVRKIILLTLALGLGIGGGLTFLRETMDTSYKTPDEVNEETQLPILVTLPFRQTEKELKSIKFKNRLAYTATGLAFILSAIAIVFASKGFDNTMEFVQKLLSGT